MALSRSWAEATPAREAFEKERVNDCVSGDENVMINGDFR